MHNTEKSNDTETNDEEKKRSLKSVEQKITKNVGPDKKAEPISHAGKKRDDSERYQ